MADKSAARVGDPVAHTLALPGVLMGLAAGAIIGAAIIATGGLGAIAIGGALAVTGGLGIGGQYIGESKMGPSTGVIIIGSTNVFVNDRFAVCATLSIAGCEKENGVPQPVATGAANVLINGMPAGREDEKIMCSAVIIDGSKNVFIGGPSVQKLPMNPEVPVLLSTTIQAMMWGGIIVGTGGIAAGYGVFAATGTLIGGFGGGWFGSISLRWVADELGFGETGQRVAEVFGGLVGSFAGSYGGFRGGRALGSWLIPKPTPINIFNFKGPSSRHTLTRVNQKTVTKNQNTVIEPGVDVAADVEAINNGLAQKIGDKFIINSRIYGIHDGTLYPISGEGFHQLNRASFKALGVLNKFGNTARANEILKNMGLSDEAINAALEVWKVSQ